MSFCSKLYGKYEDFISVSMFNDKSSEINLGHKNYTVQQNKSCCIYIYISVKLFV